jgi:hypothetical protein
MTVARFSVAKPGPAAAPRGLKARRRGRTILVSWRGVRGAAGYGVVLGQRNGLRRMVRVPAGARTAVLGGVPPTQSGIVTVRAVSALGSWGRPSNVRFRATAREQTRLRPFKNLGRR